MRFYCEEKFAQCAAVHRVRHHSISSVGSGAATPQWAVALDHLYCSAADFDTCFDHSGPSVPLHFSSSRCTVTASTASCGYRMRRIFVVVLLCCSFAFARVGSSGGRSSHGYRSGAKSYNSATKHVRSYTRKDGTYVRPHDRRAVGTGVPFSSPSSGRSGVARRYRSNYAAQGYQLNSTVQRDRNGRIKRSSGAKHSFEREHPCPSTGRSSGRCPGYVVDHVRPLECGGVDVPSNMQWQTSSQAKQKDKTEGYCRM